MVDNFKVGPRQRYTEAVVEAKEQHRRLERIEEKHQALKEEVRKGTPWPLFGLDQPARLEANVVIIGKARIALLRAQNESRRAQLEERNHGLSERRGSAKELVQKETARVQQKWNILSQRMGEARNYLCQEASLLYQLERCRTRDGREVIMLGQVEVPTLAEMNSKSGCIKDRSEHADESVALAHGQVSTVFGYLAHLTVLVAHYLTIKLPNEIILPNRASPYATIKNQFCAKPRPLHIPAPLNTLARDNPNHYTFFIDAYAMLCHDISFICFSQGLVITDIEEICRPAECLLRLLVEKETTLPPEPSAKQVQFGDFSHGAARGHLGMFEGQRFLKAWKVTLTECQDKIRSAITGDGVNLEWDIVDVTESDFGAVPLAETAFGGDGGWLKIKGGLRR